MKNIFEQYPVIKFEDIRKGDTLAAVTHNQNAFNAVVGTVDVSDKHGTSNTYWYTEGGKREVVNNSASFHPVIIHLIDRPKPEMPTTRGSAIYVKKFDGVVLDTPALVIHDGTKGTHHWFVPGGVDVPAIGGWWIDDARIEDFTLAEVKEVTA